MTWLGTDFLRLTGSRCQKLAGNGAQILTMSAMSNAAAYNNGVMVRASGIPITMAAKTHTAESRHVARPLRALRFKEALAVARTNERRGGCVGTHRRVPFIGIFAFGFSAVHWRRPL